MGSHKFLELNRNGVVALYCGFSFWTQFEGSRTGLYDYRDVEDDRRMIRALWIAKESYHVAIIDESLWTAYYPVNPAGNSDLKSPVLHHV
ncbi:hypothetical protein HAX54_020543, partial [Datura stramonium]|nr:hypothetical protein [Datura stramonium]